MSDNEKQVKMGVIPMFATPLFVFPIDNWNKYRKTILNLLPKIEAVNGISTDRSAFGEEKVLPHYAGVVFDIVEKQLEEFSKSVMDSKGAKDYTETALGITEMWYRTDTSEAQYTIANEGTVGWTAILYVDFDFSENLHAADGCLRLSSRLRKARSLLSRNAWKKCSGRGCLERNSTRSG